MGQPVTVRSVRALRPQVVRFEIDRSLTGTAHESFSADAPPVGHRRPVDILAAGLLATGHASNVHVFSNVVSVQLKEATTDVTMDPAKDPVIADLRLAMEELFIHYRPGVVPTPV